MARDFSALEDIIGYSFQDKSLIKTALTHSSSGDPVNYERLEFLGDRVLGLVIAELLFLKFPEEPEGHLAKRLAALVQGETLSNLSPKIELSDFVILSDNERDSGGASNENILADVFEALIGALYLDGGLKVCKDFISKIWSDILYTMKSPPQHPKTTLQEWAQGRGLALPKYDIVEQTGPHHAPIFKILLSIEGYEDITAEGRSRSEAEKEAALLALAVLGISQ
ncbi:MAG: ribonuclease III [Alphaproteobacteria bacterium]|nr:ribonuclease III [Alphaproteobacteria bacterium]